MCFNNTKTLEIVVVISVICQRALTLRISSHMMNKFPGLNGTMELVLASQLSGGAMPVPDISDSLFPSSLTTSNNWEGSYIRLGL